MTFVKYLSVVIMLGLVVPAFAQQAAQTNMDILMQKIKADKNPFVAIALPGMIRAREEEERYRVRWAMVRAAIAIRREGESALGKVLNPADGKPFLYTALEGGAFELKSALPIRDRQIAMTFGRPPNKTQ